ncbi:hypothetical protein [Bradyrhizobium sp. CCBAU 53338]|uniref:hypothetical protein n=1 Tax=Bradyrhizobium sp. CCBAU 53338 TaxID=1325111 RepID=UPI00188D5329|nr:hypothetical protein [Bradyrhizobium sp. CCBAU 53338]
MSSLIKAYEDNHYAITRGDPVDVLHFAIESMGRSQAELAALCCVSVNLAGQALAVI